MGGVFARQAFCRAVQVQLDDFRWAGPDEEQLLDVRAAGQQTGDFTVQFHIGIREARKILFFENRRAKARFGKNHDTSSRLQQMRAGAGADDKEERILHLAVQPDDPGQPAEHLALAAFLQNRHVAAAHLWRVKAHAGTAISSRAARSFKMNCTALTT
jgi:hypothetical protein